MTLVDYGDVQGYAEGSAMQPPEYPFTMSLAVLCENGSAEFSFRAGGAQVDSREAAGTSLLAYEKGKPPRAIPFIEGDGYANQAAAFVDMRLHRNASPARHARAGPPCRSNRPRGPPLDGDRRGGEAVGVGAAALAPEHAQSSLKS